MSAGRLFAPLFWAAVLAASTLNWRADEASRAAALSFAKTYGFAERRPAWIESARLAPSGDLAAAVVLDGARGDVLGGVDWNALSPDGRQAWLRDLPRIDEELVDARRLAVSAVWARPGWAYHRFLLGQVVYVAARRGPPRKAGEKSPEWDPPLAQAALAAPGDDAVAAFRAGALLESWEGLPEDLRLETPHVLRRAFVDAGFVARSFPTAVMTVGRDAALASLPESASPLQVAVDAASAAGDVEAAASLRSRWERAEAREGAEDLARIEERVRSRDFESVRLRCRAWALRHTPGALDGPVRRREAARLLELWPEESAGPWRNDPRADLSRYFLEGRLGDVDGGALARADEALSGVPDPIRARVRLAAGDRLGWEEVVRRAEGVGSLGWTPFFADLTRAEAKLGHLEGARVALARIAPAALEECDVLLVRRDLARLARDGQELASLQRDLGLTRRREFPPEAWADGRHLSLCVDPEEDADAILDVRIGGAEPALAAWGWDGALAPGAVLLLPGRDEPIHVPLAGLSGRHALSLYVLAGRVTASAASLRRVPATAAAAAATPPPASAASVTGIAGMEKLNSTSP